MAIFGYCSLKIVDIIAMDIRVKRMELCRLQSDGTGFLYISAQEALFNLKFLGHMFPKALSTVQHQVALFSKSSIRNPTQEQT